MQFSSLLQKAGLRATKSRIAILSFLEKQTKPVRIQEMVSALDGSVDSVTVYRVIHVCRDAGIVKEINLGNGSLSYELAPDGHGHHHVICTSCNTIEDIPSCPEKIITQDAVKKTPSFASISGHSLEFFGICKKCAI